LPNLGSSGVVGGVASGGQILGANGAGSQLLLGADVAGASSLLQPPLAADPGAAGQDATSQAQN